VNRAELQSLLVGVPLPASKDELIAYAHVQRDGARAVALLERVPERSYRAIQDVGEEVEQRQPRRSDEGAPTPRPESDLPPGGAAYLGREVEPINVANLS